MRVAIATESFAPDINGVANSVAHVVRHLKQRGHEVLVIAPRPRARYSDGDGVLRVPSLGLLGYHNVRLALPGAHIAEALREFRPDIVHLASPFVLGAWAGKAASALGIPVVAIYQTDVPGFARAHGLTPVAGAGWAWIRHTHAYAQWTLAPSTASVEQLVAHGIVGVSRWGRGVDLDLYRPDQRDEALRTRLAPGGEVIVGYVGRLAREKQVHLFAGVAAMPGVRVVIVGDGPVRRRLERHLPGAVFLGTQVGADLARCYASLDIFVHTGRHDTFGQTLQEAAASGVALVAPAAGGPLDLVFPGVNGLLFEPDDAQSLTAAVATLAADPTLRARMGEQARARVASRSWERLVDDLVETYAIVTSAPPAVEPPVAAATSRWTPLRTAPAATAVAATHRGPEVPPSAAGGAPGRAAAAGSTYAAARRRWDRQRTASGR
jgi:phosphatidylinositol alpha 1,6-mannosyltransferase